MQSIVALCNFDCGTVVKKAGEALTTEEVNALGEHVLQMEKEGLVKVELKIEEVVIDHNEEDFTKRKKKKNK